MDNSNKSFALDVDLLTLRSFLAIIDHGSFSAAADIIGRTQSAVSLQIAKLEDRLQVSLFERTSRSVKVTPEGETFAAYARKIIDLSDEGYAAVSALETSEPLRIGIAEYLVPRHLKGLLSRIKKSLPKAKVQLKLGIGFELYEDLHKQELDIILTGPEGEGGLKLYTEPLVWVGAKGYELDDSSPMEIIQMKEPCSYRKAAIDSLQVSGIIWHEEASVNNIQGVLSAVAAGFGISTMPKSAIEDNLDILTEGLPELPETSINLYWNKTNPHPVAKQCINLIKEEMKQIGLR